MANTLTRPSKSLEELQELVRIVSAMSPAEPQVLSQNQLDNSNLLTAELYRAIRDNPQLSEHELWKLQEPKSERQIGDKSERTQRNVTKAKSRLKGFLLNNLFLLDPAIAGYSEFSVNLFIVSRLAFTAQILSAFGARSLALSVAKQGLAQATKIEDWQNAMTFLFVLRGNTSQVGDARSHEVYQREFQHCLRLYSAEHEAESEMERIQLLFAKSSQEKPEQAIIVEEAFERVQKIANQFPSFKLNFLAIRLKSISAQLRLDYRATLNLCDGAFQLLQKYPIFANKARRAEYATKRLVSAVQLREWSIAEEAVKECNDNLAKADNNWFTFKEWELILLMQTLRFKEALEITKNVTSHSRFSRMSESVKEKWYLFVVYGQLATNRPLSGTMLQELNQRVPDLTNDKAGYNTLLILLQMLVLAERKQFLALRDRLEFIRGYRKRFLKGLQNSHASHFFNMLSLMESSDLNYKKILKRSANQVIELERMEKEEPIQGEQILPYSWIWDRLMERLSEYHPLAHNDQIV